MEGDRKDEMCTDRRAFFQRVNMEGSEPRITYSLNPAAWQFWATVLTIVGALWVSMTFVSNVTFDKRLQQFHMIAKPQIEAYIKHEIEQRDPLPESREVLARVAARELRDAGADEKLTNIIKDLTAMRENQAEMNKKIDELLRKVK